MDSTPADPRRFPLPPVIPLVGLLLSGAAQRLWPVALAWPVWATALGVAMVVASLALAGWAMATFRHHQTEINPRGLVTQIVASGPFRFTRNPMYLALVTVFMGASLALHLVWGAVFLVLVFGALHFGVILREEQFLEGKFGALYADYKTKVRRWV